MDLADELNRVKISLRDEDRNVLIEHADYGVFDVSKIMVFGDDIGVALETHSPTVAWWATMVAEERRRYSLFKEGLYTSFMAHCRLHAKLALRAMGDKETLESVQDYVCLLFSREKSQVADVLVEAAWRGQMLSEHTTAVAVRKYQESTPGDVFSRARAAFVSRMYYWQTEHNLTYTDVIEIELDVAKNVEVLGKILDTLGQRGILLSSLAADKRAEKSSIQVKSMVRGVADSARGV